MNIWNSGAPNVLAVLSSQDGAEIQSLHVFLQQAAHLSGEFHRPCHDLYKEGLVHLNCAHSVSFIGFTVNLVHCKALSNFACGHVSSFGK